MCIAKPTITGSFPVRPTDVAIELSALSYPLPIRPWVVLRDRFPVVVFWNPGSQLD